MKAKGPRRKTITGLVVSDKMDSTLVLEHTTRKKHPIYKKFYKVSTRIKAHDAKNEASVGDMVRITECRPISKEKNWRLVEIIAKAEAQRG